MESRCKLYHYYQIPKNSLFHYNSHIMTSYGVLLPNSNPVRVKSVLAGEITAHLWDVFFCFWVGGNGKAYSTGRTLEVGSQRLEVGLRRNLLRVNSNGPTSNLQHLTSSVRPVEHTHPFPGKQNKPTQCAFLYGCRAGRRTPVRTIQAGVMGWMYSSRREASRIEVTELAKVHNSRRAAARFIEIGLTVVGRRLGSEI